MSKERIAGRDFDAEIAERVFGARWYPTPNDMNYREAFWLQFPSEDFRDMGAGWVLGYRYADNVTPDVIKSKLPRYSEDIAAAFQVVEAMRAKGYHMRLNCVHEGRDPGVAAFFPPWGCRFIRVVDGYLSEPGHVMTAETPAHAICLSALAALESATTEKAQLKVSLSAPLPDTPRE